MERRRRLPTGQAPWFPRLNVMTESVADLEGLEDFGDFALEGLGALDNSRAE